MQERKQKLIIRKTYAVELPAELFLMRSYLYTVQKSNSHYAPQPYTNQSVFKVF